MLQKIKVIDQRSGIRLKLPFENRVCRNLRLWITLVAVD